MYRKTQLASGKSSAGDKSFNPLGTGGHGHQVGGEDVAPSKDDEFEKWVGKTKKTISGLKGGECSRLPYSTSQNEGSHNGLLHCT